MDDAKRLFEQAGKKMDDKDYDSAVSLLEKAHEMEPDNVQVIANLGGAMIKAGRYDDAVNVLEKAGSVSNRKDFGNKHSYSDCLLNLGSACLFQKDLAGAKRNFLAAIKAEPKNIQPYLNLSTLYLDEKKPKPAIATLKQGIKQNPHPELLNALGNVCVKVGKFRDAHNMFVLAKKAGYRDVKALDKKIWDMRELLPSDFGVRIE